jgi:hypothetical protein
MSDKQITFFIEDCHLLLLYARNYGLNLKENVGNIKADGEIKNRSTDITKAGIK